MNIIKILKVVFNDISVETLSKIYDQSQLLHFKHNDIIIKPEKYTQVIPMVTKGVIKVIRIDNLGNELFLYHIKAGQSCAFSLSTCLSHKPSNIKAIAEEETELIAIPVNYVIQLFNDSIDWRNFVMQTINDRFEELIRAIDSIAFQKMDSRLVEFLKSRSIVLNTHLLHLTHQDIANELGTARENISRLLKKMEKDKMIKLSRNNIEIISLV